MNPSPRPDFRMSNDELLVAFGAMIRPRIVTDRKNRARRMLAEPDRLGRVLVANLGDNVPVSVASRLQLCRKRIAIERRLALHHPSIFCLPRLDALRAAEIALRVQRRFGGRQVVPMHEVEAA